MHDFYAAYGTYDTSNCADEPIHRPGAIQPHGVIVVADDEGCVRSVSANAGEVFARDIPQLFGRPVDELGLDGRDRFTDPVDRVWSVSRHVNDAGATLYELEPLDLGPSGLALLPRMLKTLHAAKDEVVLCQRAAEALQLLLGHDRVMVHRFDREGRGEVVAEAMAPSVGHRYLGHHFPAEDIPAQARRLYLRQQCRVIVDVDYAPCPLLAHDAGPPVDMSDAVLRSVSPVHCAYLANIGVRATTTLSIVVNGQLWGLIAAHHSDARAVGPRRRGAAGILVEVLASTLLHLVEARRLRAEAAAVARFEPLVMAFEASGEPDVTLEASLPFLREVFDATAVVLARPSGRTVDGVPPHDDTVEAVLAVTDQRLWAHEQLSERLGLEPDPLGCGALVIRVGDDCLAFFRPERVEQRRMTRRPVTLAVRTDASGLRLTPEGSFEAFLQTIRHSSTPFTERDLVEAEVLARITRTARAKQLQRLERENLRMEKSARAIEAFLAMLSHELRNSLNAITGWSTMLVRGKVPPERLNVAYQAIHRSAGAQQRLVDDLLDVSRLANDKVDLRLEAVDPEEMVTDSVDGVRDAYAQKGVALEVHARPGLMMIEADRVRFQQIMWNLLGNGVKFTPASGRVEVRLANDADGVRIDVSDTGVGIPGVELNKLFDAFHQVPDGKRRQGLGLGLAIVKGLVEAHRGWVDVTSEVGVGTTFSVWLPRSPEQTDGTVVDDNTVEKVVDLTGLRVLVVDPAHGGMVYLVAILQAGGADVLGVPHPDAAREALAGSREVDMVFSRLKDGDDEASALVGSVRELPHRQQLPFVAIIGDSGRDRVRAYRSGFSAHLSEPLDHREVIAVVEAFVR